MHYLQYIDIIYGKIPGGNSVWITISICNVSSDVNIIPEEISEPILELFGLIGIQITCRLKCY